MDQTIPRHVTDDAKSMQTVILSRMPQQKDVRGPEDDWTGITNSVERRRLQNRLNQRIYRRRRRAKPAELDSTTIGVVSATTSKVPDLEQPRKSSAIGNVSNTPEHWVQICTRPDVRVNQVNPKSGSTTQTVTSIHDLTIDDVQDLVEKFERLAHQDYLLGSPKVDQLLTLIQFNVFRALISNTYTCGFTMEWLNEDAISPWNTQPKLIATACPSSLLPTTIQRTIEHHPWTDLFPFPAMRDNLLLAGESYDEWDLCNDLVEFCGIPGEKTGLIVWSDPWDPAGWEASEAFLNKWGWVIRGCTELAQSTNYWRSKRGENALVFEV